MATKVLGPSLEEIKAAMKKSLSGPKVKPPQDLHVAALGGRRV